MMANTNHNEQAEIRYLDDLKIGERFLTGMHAIDENQIVEFAKKFDGSIFGRRQHGRTPNRELHTQKLRL